MTKPMTANKMPVLPEAAFRLMWKRGAYYVDKPEIGDTDVYTADQMRAMYLAGLYAAMGAIPRSSEPWDDDEIGNPLKVSDYYTGYNACRDHALANLSALEHGAKK